MIMIIATYFKLALNIFTYHWASAAIRQWIIIWIFDKKKIVSFTVKILGQWYWFSWSISRVICKYPLWDLKDLSIHKSKPFALLLLNIQGSIDFSTRPDLTHRKWESSPLHLPCQCQLKILEQLREEPRIIFSNCLPKPLFSPLWEPK